MWKHLFFRESEQDSVPAESQQERTTPACFSQDNAPKLASLPRRLLELAETANAGELCALLIRYPIKFGS